MRLIANHFFERVGTTSLLVVLVVSPLIAQPVSNCEQGKAEAFLDINGVVALIRNNGELFRRPVATVNGYNVPAGSSSRAIFNASLWMIGKVDGTLQGSTTEYGPGDLWPGPIVNGAAPDDCTPYDRIYKMSRSDLEWFEATGEATSDMLDWPVELGAPVLDGDGIEGNYDLLAGDRPQTMGDQTLWFITNDLGNEHLSSDSEPLGIEVATTVFAAGSPDSSTNFATFYRYELTNKSQATIEDFYFGMHVDPDVGDTGDDYVGSDTTLGLAYAWNGDNFDGGERGYGDRPPAIGYLVLDGIVSADDSVDNNRDGTIDEPDEKMGMTHFLMYPMSSSLPDYLPSSLDIQYKYMQSQWWDGEPMTFGENGRGFSSKPAAFMLPGDPPEFWSEENIDSAGTRNWPGDRRFVWSSGPFRLSAGETKSITVAVLWAQGADRFDSVRLLKKQAAELRERYTTSGITASSWALPIHAPLLESPATGVGGQPTNPVFSWRGIPMADGFELEVVGEDTTWHELVRTAAFPTEPPRDLVEKEMPLLSEGHYTWRVRGHNASGYGPWSETRTFSTGSHTLTAPGAMTLEDGSYAFIQVAGLGDDDACGPEAVSRNGCDEVGGNVVYGSYNGRGDWIMYHAGTGPEGSLTDFAPNDFEIRVTEEGSYGYFSFSSGNVIWVPLVTWDIGVVGPFGVNDPSDDEQLIPVLFSDAGGECHFGFGEGDDPFGRGWQITDRVYAYYPTAANTYTGWETAVKPLVQADPSHCPTTPLTDAAADEFIDDDRGRPLQRLIFMMDPDSPDYRPEMIPVGNVIRFLTTKPVAIPLASPADGATLDTATPRLWWHTPPGVDSVWVSVASDSDFNHVVASRWIHERYVDLPALDDGNTYFWRAMYPQAPWSETWSFTIPENVGVTNDHSELPSSLMVASVFPNPIESNFVISVGLPVAGTVGISLFDALGRRVRRLAEEIVAAGWHDLKLTKPRALAPGVYFLQVSAGGQTKTRAVVML